MVITFKTLMKIRGSGEDKVDCFIDPEEVAAVLPYADNRSTICLKGGGGTVVYGEPGEIISKLREKGVNRVTIYKRFIAECESWIKQFQEIATKE